MAMESQQPPPAERTASSLGAALFNLTVSGASWRSAKEVNDNTIQSLANVRYGQDSERQSLDIYFPDDLVAPHLPSEKDDNVQQVQIKETPTPRPVYIHIHGGGWSRGSKDTSFYGGPAVSQNAASFGCIAVAPGYRLGLYPEFVHDAAAAIQWVRDNIEELGGDLNKVFLSGHSAGGHIASLLLLRHATFLAPLGIPRDLFKGLVLISGVYDLFNPLRAAPIDAKNKWFNLAYVLPAFGTDEKLRREASPLLLLEPNKDTSVLGSAARYIIRRSSSTKSKEEVTEQEESARRIDPSIEINTTCLPSTLIMNASFDMGLQENGELMAAAMQKYIDVKYVLVSGTDHASICWNPKAAKEIKDFCLAKLQKKRRGKRDKFALKNYLTIESLSSQQ